MHNPTPPLERLTFFRKELGISQETMVPLQQYAAVMAEQAEDMAATLFASMGKMAQTKIILEHETSPSRLQHNWQKWYASLWQAPCDDALLVSLWQSGLRHVNHGVDHRFITLAYSQVRRFSHERIQKFVNLEDRETTHILADRLFDLCLLVESDAYIAAQAHCSNDVMMGIAHQLRNPLTIIGGMANRLLKANGESAAMNASLEAVLGEANRMERMMHDLVAYIEMLRSQPVFGEISLEQSVKKALQDVEKASSISCEAHIAPELGEHMVQADAGMLNTLFYHLLENAQEAQLNATTEGAAPELEVRLANSTDAATPFVSLAICNPGILPGPGALEDLLQPFHSTKPYGTGLGLAIARLAAHKNFGTVQLRHWPKGGVCCQLTLVKAGHVHESGLFFTNPQGIEST